jgi:uracil DNA glycosylase
MNFKIIHPSWSPLLKEFNTDAFLTFKNEILVKEKYYPEADEVFRVFSMPLADIRLVTILNNFRIMNIEKPIEQGVFFLPVTLTEGADIDHTEYWEPFIKKVIYFIARNHPCLWVLPTIKSQSYAANLPVKTIFNVMKYDDQTIHQIPINVDYNYVFKGVNINYTHINTLLEKLGKQKINW